MFAVRKTGDMVKLTQTFLGDAFATRRDTLMTPLAHATNWLRVRGGARSKRIGGDGGKSFLWRLHDVRRFPPPGKPLTFGQAAVCTVGHFQRGELHEKHLPVIVAGQPGEVGKNNGLIGEKNDGDVLRSISPIAKVDRIRAPLFLIGRQNKKQKKK